MLLPRVVAVALAVRSAAAVEVEVGADGALHDVAARASKDAAYPMDAASRRFGAQLLASRLNASDLDGDFDRVVRPALLGACGLRDERRARPGKGNTGHCFADWNHFNARPAFKVVWCPEDLGRFVVVDDAGNKLAQGRPTGRLPPADQRRANAREFANSKYSLPCRPRASASSGAI
ncbi:hypothetical protein JL722_10858 [Aureococcus anophagefferens]|nr:hypothetical protein JL722_10858 [Aureococcus anophagefferens]